MVTHSHVRSLLPTWSVIGVGVLVAIVTGILLQRAQRANESARFESIANTHSRLFERRVMEAEITLESIGRVLTLTPDLSREDFRSLAEGILNRQRGFQALQWVPLVSHETRAEFENRVRQDGFSDFQIFNRTEEGVVVAPAAEHYLPITYIEPMEGNEAALGYNVFTAPTLKFLDIAREERRLAISAPFRTIQNVGDQYGIVIILPVFVKGSESDLLGYVQAVFRMGDLLSMTLLEDAAAGVFLRVTAEAADGQVSVVYDDTATDESSLHWRDHHSVMRIRSQRWDFHYSASNSWSGRSFEWSTWLAVFGLVGCAGALALHVQSTADQNSRISRLVETRTAQLEKETIERLHRQERLAESEARYSILYNSLPDAVLVVESGLVQIMNEAARTLFDVPNPERGEPIEFQKLLSNVSGSQQVLEGVSRTLHSDQSFQLMNLTVRCDGCELVVTVRGELVLWMGRPAVQLVFQDVTREMEAAERERGFQEKISESQRLESLGLMAGGIAHDFNNILTGILVNANLAKEIVPDKPAVTRHLHEIELASLRAADLCNSMLSYAGKNPKHKSTINLADLVADTLKLVRASISSTTAMNFTPPAEPLLLAGDAAQLQQVIMNLIINASDAMDGKPGQVEIRLESAQHAVEEGSRPQNFGRFTIADNGKGMSPDIISRIFDPFFTTKTTGRGLGLSAAQGVVRSHDGHLRVESQEGIGTTFTLDFPLATKADLPATAIPSAAEEDFKAEGKILMAEDERLIRLVFEAGLRKRGFEVKACEDGLAAAEEFEKDPGSFRFAIVDINMPRLDGHETIKRLHKTRPELPIVIISGFNEDNVAELYINKPGFIFVQKPFEMKAFMAAVSRLLSQV